MKNEFAEVPEPARHFRDYAQILRTVHYHMPVADRAQAIVKARDAGSAPPSPKRSRPLFPECL